MAQKINAELKVRNWLEEYDRKPSSVQLSQQPKEITCWTRTSITQGLQHRYGDSSGLLPFRQPHLPAYLLAGYPQEFIKKPEDVDVSVINILRAVNMVHLPLYEYDVVSYRNNLNKLFLSVNYPEVPWVVDACMQQRILFLDIFKLHDDSDNDPFERFHYMGYKFESLCTGQDTVDSSSQYSSVFETSLGDLRLLVAAEIDCYDPKVAEDCPDTDRISSYLELKTHKVCRHNKDWMNLYRFKYPRWWLPSRLAGVSSIAIGAKDHEGYLRSIALVDTTQLVQTAREEGCNWGPQRTLAWGEYALKWMRRMGDRFPEEHLRFTYEPQDRVIFCTSVANGQLVNVVRAELQGP